MLVHNTVIPQTPVYYPDPRMMLHPNYQPTAPHPEDNYYGPQVSNAPHSQHPAYYQYEYREDTRNIPDCSCRQIPLQETFLHQILTGKGYKNDCLFVSHPIKMEPYHHDYSCCYATMPPHHPGSYSGYHQQ